MIVTMMKKKNIRMLCTHRSHYLTNINHQDKLKNNLYNKSNLIKRKINLKSLKNLKLMKELNKTMLNGTYSKAL
jgi:hypothetical protein